VNTVKAMREGRVRFFLGLGGNFLSAAPGTKLTASALKSCELTTHISQSSTARIWCPAALPSFCPVWADPKSTDKRRVRKFASQELRSEPAIIAGIAKATLGKRLTVNWDDLTVNYAKIRDSIARVIPVFRKFQRADSRGLLSSATLCPPSQRIPKPAAQGEGHRA
jgi:formate dehydrogenase major subunit